MKRGELAWVETDYGRRPGILIDVEEGWVTVVTGTGTTGRDIPNIEILPNNVAGKVFGLSKKTAFYVTSIAVVRPEAVTVKGLCPMRVFLDLEALLDANAPPA